MNVEPIQALAGRWREEAALYRKRGQKDLAAAAESYAAELETGLNEWMSERLTLEEAAKESGYSYSTLQHRLREGSLPNVGEKGTPRVRRCDLPRKGREGRNLHADGPDLVSELLAGRVSR